LIVKSRLRVRLECIQHCDLAGLGQLEYPSGPGTIRRAILIAVRGLDDAVRFGSAPGGRVRITRESKKAGRLSVGPGCDAEHKQNCEHTFHSAVPFPLALDFAPGRFAASGSVRSMARTGLILAVLHQPSCKILVNLLLLRPSPPTNSQFDPRLIQSP